MEDLPQLEPLSLRPECEPGYEKESWKPTWNCYCCQDTGFVLEHLGSKIIPGFSSEKHKTLLCNASRCNASRDKVSHTLINEGNFDTRLSSQICARLHEMERETWKQYRWNKHQLKKEALVLVEELAEKKSVRRVKRSAEEEKSEHQ